MIKEDVYIHLGSVRKGAKYQKLEGLVYVNMKPAISVSPVSKLLLSVYTTIRCTAESLHRKPERMRIRSITIIVAIKESVAAHIALARRASLRIGRT